MRVVGGLCEAGATGERDTGGGDVAGADSVGG